MFILLPVVVVFVFTKFQRDLSELDICCIYLEEYHEPVFCIFNRLIRYTVNFSDHTLNTEDSEGESPKNLVRFSSSWELINTMQYPLFLHVHLVTL